MTKARIQPFCKANKINNGYFHGKEVALTFVTEKKRYFHIITIFQFLT